MYRGPPSPIFDVPEFPALRRIRPLPKRRRTESHGSHNHSLPPPLPPGAAAALLHQQQHSLDLLGPNATTEDLLSHAENLSALHSYYMPILGGVQNFLAGASASDPNGLDISGNTTAAAAAAAALAAVADAGRNGQLSLPLGNIDSVGFGVHLAAAAAAAAAAGVAIGGLGGFGMGMMDNMGQGLGMSSGGNSGMMGAENSIGLGGHDRDDDDPRNADHYDQARLHGHGNTKKRKVPANAHSSPRGGSGDGRPGSPSSYRDGEGNEATGGHDGDGFEIQDEDLIRERDRDRERDRERDRDRDRERDPDRDDSSSSSVYPPPPFPGQLSLLAQKRGKLTAVTLAGLQHKELLKTRKRQLAAVMGALSHGDTLALDQALSTNYPLLPGMSGALGMSASRVGGDSPTETDNSLSVRKSKRRTVRLARAMKVLLEMPERRNRHPDAVPFPVSEFLFSCPSGTAERLISTKEEVVALRKRFETELARQAAKAAKTAAASTGTGGKAMTKAAGGRGKKERQDRDRERAEKIQQRVAKSAPTAVAPSGGAMGKGGEHLPESIRPALSNVSSGTPSGGGGSAGGAEGGVNGNGATGGGTGGMKTKAKKKKRSALANASNPHHLRNYVPSRLPHTGDGVNGGKVNANGSAAGGWQLPLLFLSSEIAPRRRDRGKKTSVPMGSSPLIQLTQPSEEWICAFCEYDLFYGNDAAYRRAVRSRKKILRRRRRARERAAAAASGVAAGLSTAKAPPPPPPSEEYDDGYDEADEAGVDDYGSAPPQRNARWKAGPDKESAAFG